MILCLLFLFYASVFRFSTAEDIADYFHACKKSDPNLGECFNQSVELFRPFFKNGIPKIGLMSLDPFTVNKISLFNKDGKKRANEGLTWYFENLQIVGISNFYKTKSIVDLEKKMYNFHMIFPDLSLTSNYYLKLGNIETRGKVNFTAEFVEMEEVILFEIVPFKNKEVINLTFLDLKLTAGKSSSLDIKSEASDDFAGKYISNILHQLVIYNKEDLIDFTTPYLERFFAKVYLQYLNNLIKNVDYNRFFPD